MAFELPSLPWAENALEPHISAETIQYHYGKHHQAYVTNLNKLTENTPFADSPLEEIILKSDGGVFNNAAQVWNHSFYWNCLSPQGGGDPEGALATAITSEWGDLETFRAEFTKAAATRFGSGWAWLVLGSDAKLKIVSTANADNPMTDDLTPLLTCDVWEHAYYIDTRNNRPQYIENFWKLVNWDFVAKNLEQAS